MCGLYGFLSFGQPIKSLSAVTNALAQESAVRGTDAVGIAINKNGKVYICKEGKSAYSVSFKHNDGVRALIGHTRHSTQGSEKHNYNNHPFQGMAGKTQFALAHNGVLGNDDILRETYNLKNTKIETDSYIAVQLIEHKGELSMESLKFMAEEIAGSFSFSILDNEDNIYLVKGDSPLSILYFPEYKLYVYASTEEILWKALITTFLFEDVKANKYEEIPIKEGEILKICNNGKIERGAFNYTDYACFGIYDWCRFGDDKESDVQAEYIEMLREMADYNGYGRDTVDDLLEEGFTIGEIEEYIYTADYVYR